MRAMALASLTLCWLLPYVWAEFDQSNSSSAALSVPELLLASSTAHGMARPNGADATASTSTSIFISQPPTRPTSVTPSSKSHVPTRGASPNGGGTHRPHLVTLSSTTFTVRPSHPPHPTALPSPEQAPHPQPPQRPQPIHHPHHRSNGGLIVGIVFGVLGGIAGFFLLFALGRCLHSWRRTPARDRIRATMDRHYLEREMEEREREDLERRVVEAASFRRTSLRGPPPPPYQPAPAYDAVVGSESEDTPMVGSSTPERAEFAMLPPSPPPPSPPPPAVTRQTSWGRGDGRRSPGDGRHEAGPDLV